MKVKIRHFFLYTSLIDLQQYVFSRLKDPNWNHCKRLQNAQYTNYIKTGKTYIVMQLLHNVKIIYKCCYLQVSMHKNIDMNYVTPLWMSKVSQRMCIYTCINVCYD